MATKKRALVICAHDDDEVIGPGGTICKLARRGVEITTVIFACGNEGYTSLNQKNTIVEERKKERCRAQRILGTAGCIAYDYHDFENLESEDVYRKIMHAVRRTRPDVVFSHLPTDYLAHRTLSKIVGEAVWQAGWQCSLDLGRPWQVDRIYQFAVLEMISKPSHIVDITETMQAKIRAMKAYRSQHKVVSQVLEQIEAKARAYGSMIGVKYGEAFVRSQFIPVAVKAPVQMLESSV